MQILSSLLFIILLGVGFGIFFKNAKTIYSNIKLGQPEDRSDNAPERLKNMLRVAFGQSKMTKRPIAAVLHLFVYVGFLVINLELIEIIIDGIFGTHRVLSFLGGFYNALIFIFEILAALIIVSIVVFWIRRNVMHLKRLNQPELDGWPKKDANTILYLELLMMSFFLLMNAADFAMQTKFSTHELIGSYPVSQYLSVVYGNISHQSLHLFERIFWWGHIAGVMFFMNYLYYSKHLHIILAFPNTYYANLNALGKFSNLESVTNEVKLMLDPNADPFAAPATDESATPSKFGASDVQDLSWIQLMNAYSCTECGRCTSSCPANLTGKKLSPRLIMMKTRDRLEEVGKNIKANKGVFVEDGKSLLNHYITPEELWACTTCNACVEECPINISPLSIIMDMRRYLVMEQSAAPNELNLMMTNIENNSAPWQYNQMDRLNWKDEN